MVTPSSELGERTYLSALLVKSADVSSPPLTWGEREGIEKVSTFGVPLSSALVSPCCPPWGAVATGMSTSVAPPTPPALFCDLIVLFFPYPGSPRGNPLQRALHMQRMPNGASLPPPCSTSLPSCLRFLPPLRTPAFGAWALWAYFPTLILLSLTGFYCINTGRL